MRKWHTYGYVEERGEFGIFEIGADGKRYQVAAVPVHPAEVLVGRERADLMAASPDMFEALMELTNEVAKIPSREKSTALQEACARGFLAIGKALGKSK
jgi:hypothetical protein